MDETIETSPLISAVLIVKNEEALLERCLQSLDGIDEIVVCDTGSTDDTVNIVKTFAFIYNIALTHFEWCDDFAAARNYAKSFATHDWVLSIDADEVLAPDGVDRIRTAITNAKHASTLAVRLVAEGSGHEHWVPRIFRKEIDWVGQVHELPAVTAQMGVDTFITYGYSPAHDQDPDRTLRILESIADPAPRDLYYLAREYHYRQQWESAVDVYSKYLDVATWMPERADAWLMTAQCLWQLQRGDEAREACAAAIVNNANFREALEFMAEMSWDDNADRWRSFAELADNRNVLFVRT
jgi:glycosyltransferase involved in cell wall biosynthesis